MITVFFDAESYYERKNNGAEKAYSLRNMSPVEYILHPYFELIGASISVYDGKTCVVKNHWREGEDAPRYLRRLLKLDTPNPVQWRLVSHNAPFDACILAYRYNIHPDMIACTLSMARSAIMHLLPDGRLSLDKVAGFLGLGRKTVDDHGASVLIRAAGMHLNDMHNDPMYYEQYKKYAINDNVLCAGIWFYLRGKLTPMQHYLMHIVIRMATQPQFTIDKQKLYDYLSYVQDAKATLLDRVSLLLGGDARGVLMSNDKFGEALQALGVDPPTKLSPATGQPTYAFSKQDKGLTDLLDHDDLDVQGLVAARLGVKSTIEETRTERYIAIANCTEFAGSTVEGFTYPGKDDGEAPIPMMPIPLKIHGAHTGRYSGDWKLNAQNLASRGNTSLRQSLVAPRGRIVLACDAAQIEARLTAWIGGQGDLVSAFAEGRDPYSEFASDLYGRPISKANPLERLVGKIGILSLGFSAGALSLLGMMRAQMKGVTFTGKDGTPELFVPDLGLAKRSVNAYRRKYDKIVKTWDVFRGLIDFMASAKPGEFKTHGPLVFEREQISLPDDTGKLRVVLRYARLELRGTETGQNYFYFYGGRWKKLYPGKLMENIAQMLDYVCVMEAAVRIDTRLLAQDIYLPLAHQVHDELIYIPEIGMVPVVEPIIAEEMARRPTWGRDYGAGLLTLAAESKIGPNYGALKPY